MVFNGWPTVIHQCRFVVLLFFTNYSLNAVVDSKYCDGLNIMFRSWYKALGLNLPQGQSQKTGSSTTECSRVFKITTCLWVRQWSQNPANKTRKKLLCCASMHTKLLCPNQVLKRWNFPWQIFIYTEFIFINRRYNKVFLYSFLGSCHYYCHYIFDLILEVQEYGTAVSRD